MTDTELREFLADLNARTRTPDPGTQLPAAWTQPHQTPPRDQSGDDKVR